MGVPVPKRSVEEASKGAGPLYVTTLDRLDPKTREELIRKYNLKLREESEEMEAAKTMEKVEELTREKYVQHKEDGWTDSQIRKHYGFKFPNDLTKWKRENGLEGYRVNVTPEQRLNINGSQLPKDQPKEEMQAPDQEQHASQEEKAVTPLPPFRKTMIELLQSGKTVVDSREEAFRLVNVLEAMEIGWQLNGKGSQYWVSLME
jgi:hypothetical protein